MKKGGSVSSLSSDEVNEIYLTYSVMYSKGLAHYSYDYSDEGRKRIVNHLIDSAKVVQRAWRAFKLRPETWAKRVWNMVRNDGSPDRKKYLGILSTRERKINPQIQEEYDLHTDEYVNCIKKAYNENIAQKYIKEYLAKRATGYKEYNYYYPSNWAEMKKYQLYNRLNTVAYIVTL